MGLFPYYPHRHLVYLGLNALPGLAVSPILGKLSAIFPHSTELDIQMLSSLPSLLIIPFILLAGKLTERVEFHPSAPSRTCHLCSKRSALPTVGTDVATDCRECLTGE